jgi:hypothetical protein
MANPARACYRTRRKTSCDFTTTPTTSLRSDQLALLGRVSTIARPRAKMYRVNHYAILEGIRN